MTLLSFDCQIIQHWTLQEEITCLDIHETLIAVGLWNSTVQLISLSTKYLNTTRLTTFRSSTNNRTNRHPPNKFNPPDRFSRRNVNNLFPPTQLQSSG